MNKLIFIFTLAVTSAASAQMLSLPPQGKSIPATVKLYNKATNEPIGTATHDGNRIYFRDQHGVHYATIEIAPDGTRTTYDPNGKVLK